ncbi:MAG TPA: HD domain-containing protein [Dongiaceae bacterium]|nr:HD domain-containing protein [Dongiaceae bacterium]
MIARVRHLGSRFFGSLRPRPLGPDDLTFVRENLTPAELACWERLGPADRVESVKTARAAASELGCAATETWIAAALLHDVGKTETRFGPFRRAGATAVAIVLRERRVRRWDNAVGRYVDHDERGARILERAGARREAVEWAAIHHRPERWPGSAVPPEMCRVLAAADGEPLRV